MNPSTSILCVLILVTLFPSASSAQVLSVPAAMTYQGRLTDTNSSPLPDGTGYEIEVRLWTTLLNGSQPIWAARYTGLPVKNGAFNIILGSSGTSIPGAITPDLKAAVNTPNVHLGLTTPKSATGASTPL